MNHFKGALNKAGSSLRSIRSFYFICGFFLGLILYFYTEDQYEKELFGALANNIKAQAGNQFHNESVVLSANHLVHALEQDRQAAFSGMRLNGFKARYLQPITYDLMTGKGACGSNSRVLARLLIEMDYPVRIAQMKVNNNYGGHIVVEANVKGKWVVLDPLYDLSFRKTNGEMASFNEVGKDWANFKNQLPEGYNPAYNYQGVRYTNWDKVPVLLPALYKTLTVVKGQQWADQVSLRVIILRKFRFFLILSIAGFALLLSTRIRLLKRKRTSADPVRGKMLQVA
jgi:hypothetical protein